MPVAVESLDCLGMKCPQPVLKIAMMSRSMPENTLLEVLADCHEFPNDVKKWCSGQGKVLVSCTDTGGGSFKAQIQF